MQDDFLKSLLFSGTLWFFLAMILNRWVFERASNDKLRFLVMPLAVAVNTFLAYVVFSTSEWFSSDSIVICGGMIGVMAGAATGLMLSQRKPNSREVEGYDRLS